ncbi:MAG: SPOR domain-containing protein [Burkholderiales bacterium]|jgi:cell division protein FtsN|nr:SPOR domain-containing protein [Nitrosomonadaceae bacterium]
MNPLFAGIIIGVVLGVFIALGVAIWLNRNANPFVEKSKPVEALAPIKQAAPAKPGDPAAPGEKPRFEFYDILPGDGKTAPGKAAKPTESAAPHTPAAAAPAPPASLPAPAPAASNPAPSKPQEPLFLQAGAFQNESDAESLKAKIAFAGFEATVKPVNVAGKGTLYRVRLGPFRSQEEVNRIKSTLSQAGINAAVVKPE